MSIKIDHRAQSARRWPCDGGSPGGGCQSGRDVRPGVVDRRPVSGVDRECDPERCADQNAGGVLGQPGRQPVEQAGLVQQRAPDGECQEACLGQERASQAFLQVRLSKHRALPAASAAYDPVPASGQQAVPAVDGKHHDHHVGGQRVALGALQVHRRVIVISQISIILNRVGL